MIGNFLDSTMEVPNGFFVRDSLSWGSIPQFVSKGFTFVFPDQTNAPDTFLNLAENAKRGMVQAAGSKWRIQVCWSVTSDYQEELLSYDKFTQTLPDGWVKKTREEIVARYWKAMKQRKLRREVVRVYFSRKIPASIPVLSGQKQRHEFFKSLFEEINRDFDLLYANLQSRFATLGVEITPMKDVDHYRHYEEFLNPSKVERHHFNPNAFNPYKSIQENSLRSDWASGHRHSSPFGFYYDGFYHNILTLRRLPNSTEENTFLELTRTDLKDYSITVNLYPMVISKAVKTEQDAINDLTAAYSDDPKHEYKVGIEMRQERIERMRKGDVTPFEADFIITIRANSLDKLARETEVLKTIIEKMSGAEYHQPLTSATSRKLWWQSWPGWIFGAYKSHALYFEDDHLARLLPLSSTFTGHLKDSMAIFDGSYGGLVGWKCFQNASPQHMLTFGTTGSGKSMLNFAILSQIASYFKRVYLIEEGRSYGPFVRKMNGQSIVFTEDGNYTINYLDTRGLPLTNEALAAATALAGKMAGTVVDENVQNLRLSLIRTYITHLYTALFENFIRFNPDKLTQYARQAIILLRLLRHLQKEEEDSTFLDAWTYARDNAETLDYEKALASVSDEEISQAIESPEIYPYIRNIYYAYLKPEEMPQHSALVETMKRTPLPEHDARMVRDIATQLESWCAYNGPKLFDGVTNVSFENPVLHFELGKLSQDSPLRVMAGFLVANTISMDIVRLPRSWWKCVQFEEVASYLNIPGADKMVERYWSQMRKYRAWLHAITQNFQQYFKAPESVRATLFDNSKQYLFLRHENPDELARICRYVDLPEVTRRTILNYQQPEHVNFEYSQATYRSIAARGHLCGTMNIRLSEALIEAEREFWSESKTINIKPQQLLESVI